MKKSHKGLLILAVPFVLGFLAGYLVRGSRGGDRIEVRAEAPAESAAQTEAEECAECADEAEAVFDDVDGLGEKPERKEIIYYRDRLPYARLFADLNEAHLRVARQLGLQEIPKTREDFSHKGLVRIEDNEHLVVDELQYSIPYLTEGAAEELYRIARAFSDSLKSKNLLDYKLVVTSLLRTEEDVDRLRRSGNPNASDNSAHCYGTTFDITYTRYYSEDESEAFMQPFELTKVLGEVLLDEKNAARCLVKYEKQEHCFHITSCVK